MINTKEMYEMYVEQGMSKEDALKKARTKFNEAKAAGIKNNKEVEKNAEANDNGYYRRKVRYVG